MAHALNTSLASLPLSTRLRSFAESVRKAWELNNEYRRTYTELASLSDRDLADIGIQRDTIADLAKAHVYGA